MGYVANGYPVTIGSKLTMVGIDILWNSIMFIPMSVDETAKNYVTMALIDTIPPVNVDN